MKKVLIVEDAELNRDLLQQLLEDTYEVVIAVDGLSGLEAAQRERPDLVLMDMALPGIDGWEATRRLKADPELCHIPIIAVTSHAMRGDEAKALACGCDAYLSKPIDEDRLYDLLSHHLGRRQAGEERGA